MKHLLSTTAILFLVNSVFANGKDSIISYNLPDSVKAVSFLAEVSVGTITTKKEVFAGIKTDVVKLSLESDKKEREIVFEFPSAATVMVNGIGVKTEKGEISWAYNWVENENYRLLIATASDSAGNFALYSGYIFLPQEKKWKLIGTCKILGQWNTLKQPAFFYSRVKRDPLHININEVWSQRNTGSWKNLVEKNSVVPVINLLSHIDSLQQLEFDKWVIKTFTSKPINPDLPPYIKQGFIDDTTYKNVGGICYQMIKEGTGRQVSVNDTVTVFYKGYLLKDSSVFDETKDKPATFPLKRLIMGWQIGVPLCKVGGKIKIIIPSTLAYSIRTRAAKIPPNSILVFEIEVVDAKAPQ
jgi:FKBP-type peptidyl-prolyl cis-trans isomerase FkpA